MAHGFANDTTVNRQSGQTVQVVNFQTGAMTTGSTAIPFDTSIPQVSEGDQFMTLNITPTNASNILLIDVYCFVGNSSSVVETCALFIPAASANAIACISGQLSGTIDCDVLTFQHRMVAGGTSTITFTVRAGGAAGTTTFNGFGGVIRQGGVMASSITITEIQA